MNFPVREADERMLEVFDHDSIRRIVRNRIRDGVPSVELQGHFCSCWFGHAARLPGVELIKDLLLPTPPPTWHRRNGSQMKMWATTIKAGLGPLYGPRVFGCARWGKVWVKASNELAQDRRAWSASIRGMVNWIGDTDSTRLRRVPPQVQVQSCVWLEEIFSSHLFNFLEQGGATFCYEEDV